MTFALPPQFTITNRMTQAITRIERVRENLLRLGRFDYLGVE